jgi:hypothetical protein
MERRALIVLVSLIAMPTMASAQGDPEDRSIAEALSALPQPLRKGAEVRAFRNGELVTIRRGDNGMICLADDPSDDRWHVACYHADLEPFMARGRQLRAEGITDRARIDSIRGAEIESGELSFPDHPAALYSWFGDATSFNPETGEAEKAQGLYVLYVPYATAEETGLTMESSPERPWLMFPGKPWAHVMIAR